MAEEYEEAVLDLVGKIGLDGLMRGLVDHLADQRATWATAEDDSDEPDAALEWLDRLSTLARLSLPYAVALSGSEMESRDYSDGGASITITVDQK